MFEQHCQDMLLAAARAHISSACKTLLLALAKAQVAMAISKFKATQLEIMLLATEISTFQKNDARSLCGTNVIFDEAWN